MYVAVETARRRAACEDAVTVRVTAMWCHTLSASGVPRAKYVSPPVTQAQEQPAHWPQLEPQTPPPLGAVQHVEAEELPEPLGTTMPKPAPLMFRPMRTSWPPVTLFAEMERMGIQFVEVAADAKKKASTVNAPAPRVTEAAEETIEDAASCRLPMPRAVGEGLAEVLELAVGLGLAVGEGLALADDV